MMMVLEVVAASGGEWCGRSYRLGEGEYFGVRQKSRQRRRPPGVAVAGGGGWWWGGRSSFRVDAVEDFKENMLRDYCCWFWLKLLVNAADENRTHVAPTTAEQRLARKNELKVRGTLLMALPDKHQLKFNIYKDAKSLMEATEKRFVSAVISVSAANTKVPVYALPNVDNLSDAVIYSFFGFDMSKVECYNCHRRGHFARECSVMALVAIIRAFRQMKNQQTITFTSSSSSSSDNEVAPCSKACIKAYATLKSQYDKLTNDLRKSQFDVLSYKTGLEYVEARLVVYQQNENMFEEDIKLLKLNVMLRDKALVELRHKFEKAKQERDEDKALVELRHKFEKAKQERDELKLKLEKFQTSSKNLNKLLACQIFDKTGLGYNNQVFNNIMFDCDELITSVSDVSMPTSLVHDRYQSGEGYHVVPPPYTGTFMPSKPDLVFHDAPTANETVPIVLNVEPSTIMPNKDLSQTSVKLVEHPIPAEHLRKDIPKTTGHRHSWNRKACFVCKSLTYLIKEYDYYEKKMVQKLARNYAMQRNHQHYARMKHSHPNTHVVPTTVLTRSRLVPLTTARPITTVVPQTKVKHQRPAKHVVNKVNAVEGVKGNWHALKDKGVIDIGYSRHMTGNLSYLSDFEEINRGYVAFGGNPKGGKITVKRKIRIDTECIVLSSDFKFPDETHVLLRVLRENNMYNFDLKNIVPSGNLVRGLPSKAFENNHTCVACEKGKQHRASYPQNIDAATFEVKKPESAVHVSPSSCDKTMKHHDKTKREAKGKSFVEFTPVPAVGPNSTKSTNTFSATGPSNNAISSNFELGGKYSFMDPSQYPDDPDMPALDDITYSDNKEDVGVEGDFSNLETNITVSPIPTTRVDKDHLVTQIISDLSSAPQTRSMTRMVKEQGGLTQINDGNFHTCMFACFLSQEEPKRVHQALKDPSWIEAIQEEPLQFKMQKEECIDYEEVFAPVSRIEAIYFFLAYASFMGFLVYQMDVKSAFLYGTIKEEVYVCQPLGFEDPDYPDKVYKVVKALYGLHQAPRAWYETLTNYLLENGFQRGKIDQTLLIKNQKDGKSANTPIDIEKPLLKDPDGEDVDVHTYRSMIGLLMYLTSPRPYIMFAVCACARFQVTPKALHLYAVKRIFRQIFNAVSSMLLLFGLTIDAAHLLLLGHKTSVSIKKTNDVVMLQALIDRKKVIITEDSIRHALRLDDADSVDCLPNKEIFPELARMGYEKPSTKLTFYKAFFSSQWKFLIHIILQCMSAKRTAWNEFSSSMASAVIYLATVFANMRRVRKGFSWVDTPLFAGMLVPQQAQDVKDAAEYEDDVNEVFDEPTPPSPTPATPPPPPQQEHIPLPPQADTATPSPPSQQQPSQTAAISMTLLNTLLETCATLTKQGENLKQDKIAQAIEITKLKQRVKRIEKKRQFKSSRLKRLKKGRKISKLNADEDVTLEEVDDEVTKDADVQGRQAQIEQDEAFSRELEAKLNANINWNDVVDQVKRKEKQDNTVMGYQALKRKHVTEAQARKNMMPDVEASIWRNQRGRYGLAKVKSWKLFKSYGVHIITFTTIQMILLVERKYPLTRFTLEEMLNNVRLEVEEESEMSLEFLSFGVDAVEDFKENMLRDYCCWFWLKLLVNAGTS
uniref:CCHC-type domain-containing protein n=1 Tax=Tanacetum cinerariifolium TaxID=118510 RepID=A0A6L2K190_TANCI|nr:hypothetical protein [Tanacetum cinerariifolium]